MLLDSIKVVNNRKSAYYKEEAICDSFNMRRLTIVFFFNFYLYKILNVNVLKVTYP